ncbi:hypothetical protein FE784_31560 [Paenibacillus hemerocallicola]|uniref:Uncharacterized protein n=1 Tax=Paenibacillus hemerocallicola TaxID=1172614 RepID=A0A5C4SZX2_9BACL|nr:hypothetical protein [Paenibacillus hemerocallicola]TNJ62226.1 hypothetical protein FE784_31560 [Paenibacillus hemerocallicola]
MAIIRYHHVAGGDERFFEQVQSCYERYKPGTVPGFRLPEASALQPDTGELEESGLFEFPVVWGAASEEVYTRSRYLDLLSTYSDHRMMKEEDAQAVRLYHFNRNGLWRPNSQTVLERADTGTQASIVMQSDENEGSVSSNKEAAEDNLGSFLNITRMN